MRRTALFLLLLAVLSLTPGGTSFAAATPVTLTIYNQDLAVVEEVRALHLARGTQVYTLSEVTERIDPTSVLLRSLTAPDAVRLLEQRFAFDLTGTGRLLERHVGQPIVVTIREGGTYSGQLLSAAGGDAILEMEGGSILVVKEDEITTLQFPALPEGLTTKPTLVWLLECTRPGKHDTRISYLTGGMQWQAEYTAGISEGEEGLVLSGWASIENRSGMRFRDARVQLVAGDVHRTAPQPYLAKASVGREVAMMAEAPSPGFEEQPVFEYHLYTLDRPATLEDMQAKQLTLFPPASVKATKAFTFDGSQDRDKVRINIVLENTEANGLGRPLPAGRIRAYKESAGGNTRTFAGEDRIDHVAVGEEVRLYLGNTFDVVGERIVKEARQISKRSRQETVEIRLSNQKEEAVDVTVIEHLRGDWKLVGETPAIRKREARKVEFDVSVPAKDEKVFSYQVLYTW